jgi:hypothetical protein
MIGMTTLHLFEQGNRAQTGFGFEHGADFSVPQAVEGIGGVPTLITAEFVSAGKSGSHRICTGGPGIYCIVLPGGVASRLVGRKGATALWHRDGRVPLRVALARAAIGFPPQSSQILRTPPGPGCASSLNGSNFSVSEVPDNSCGTGRQSASARGRSR